MADSYYALKATSTNALCLEANVKIQSHFALLLLVFAAQLSCTSTPIDSPETRRQYYKLIYVGQRSLPAQYGGCPNNNSGTLLSGTLVPYALGRPGDQRLVNDRTGGGSTGGNSRDTTVQRGQMMDIRVLRCDAVFRSDPPIIVHDSSIVDVEIRDIYFFVTRPHRDSLRTVIDSGYFYNHLLLIPTRPNSVFRNGPTTVLQYEITR